MILSHKLKLIFFAVPKTGTHAIRFALRELMGEEDEEQVGLFVKKQSSIQVLAEIRHGHIKASELKPHLSSEIWNTYFKFGVVRNPWDKYISFCAFMNKNNPDFKADPKKYIHQIIDRPRARKRILFRPQYEFLYDGNGDCLVDYVGRFEDLQSTYNVVADKCNFTSQSLEKINESTHNNYRDYYDDELKEKIAYFYREDIELFDYKF